MTCTTKYYHFTYERCYVPVRYGQSVKDTRKIVERIQRFAKPIGNEVILETINQLACSRNDPFSKLPPELLEAIFVELPLSSVCSLRICVALLRSAYSFFHFFPLSVEPSRTLGVSSQPHSHRQGCCRSLEIRSRPSNKDGKTCRTEPSKDCVDSGDRPAGSSEPST